MMTHYLHLFEYSDSFGRKISKIRSWRNVIIKVDFTKIQNSMSHYRIWTILVSKVLEFIRESIENNFEALKYHFEVPHSFGGKPTHVGMKVLNISCEI